MSVRLGTTLAVCACIAMIALALSQSSNGNIDASEHWKDRIHAIGALAAYDEFVLSEDGKLQTQQHMDAHQFGEALFETVGIDGIGICDARFSYGCFHQVIGMALSQSGPGMITAILDGCQKSLGSDWNACRHSIGHGIISYVGYRESDLVSALALCDQIPSERRIPECYRGAFMEFNHQAMLGEDGRTRELPEQNPYHPCDTFDGAARRACLYVQPQLWHFLERGDGPAQDVFARFGVRCRDLLQDDRTACFEGIGTSIAWDTNLQIPDRARLCDAASLDTSDRALCKSHLAFWLVKIARTDSNIREPESACDGLDEDARRSCTAYAANTAQ